MLQFLDVPFTKVGDNLAGDSRYKPTMAIPISLRGSGVQYAPFASTVKQVTSLALAAAASLTLWTPGGSNVIMLSGLVVESSVATSLQVIWNSVVQFDVLPQANIPLVLITSVWPGFFCYPTASVITIKNNGAGAGDFRVTAYGQEVGA